jgi:hypothetical protein
VTRPAVAVTELAGREGGRPARAGTITVPEIVIGLAVLVFAVFSWMALLLMDNHVGHLGYVALAAAGCLVVVLAVTILGAVRPAVSLDPWCCAVLVVVGLVAGFFFFPGFHYAATDKDPGGYVEMGAAFARHASYSFPDTLARHVPGIADFDPGERFPALWIQGGNLVVPQFYHLWPALLAMAFDVGGLGLEFQVAPFAALIAVLAFVLMLRRAVPGRASLPAAALGGLLLATNMLEVWQAKYPTTEAFAQMIFVALLLGVLVALTSGWAPAAGLSGLLLGIGWLERPDAIVIAAVAVGVGAVLLGLRRWSPACWWFTGGLLVTLPHVLWQAYAAARAYTLGNGVPRLSSVAGGAVALLLAGALAGSITPLRRWVTARLSERRSQFYLGASLCFAVLVAMVVGFLRRRLFGETYHLAGTVLVPTYNEQNMHRLAWFISFPGWALAGLGVAAISLRRWRASLWVPLVPALLITPVYIFNDRIASRLMWWGRRFVPEVLPGLIALIVIALGAFLLMRRRPRLLLAGPAAVLAAYLLWHSVDMSARLRHHDEMGGSVQVVAAISSTAHGARGIYLFPRDPCCTAPVWLFGGATWLEENQYAAVLPEAAPAAYAARIHHYLPANPVFVVVGGTQPPPGMAGLRPTPVLHVVRTVTVWQESDVAWPEHEGPPIHVDFTVWRLTDF